MTAPTLPICEKIARMRDYRADVYGIAADGVDVLLGDCHDTIEALYEALDALVEAVMDDDICEAFPIAKHAGQAALAKARGESDQ